MVFPATGVINLAVALLMFSAAAGYAAFDAWRWRNRRRLLLAGLIALPLMVGAAFALWIGLSGPSGEGTPGFGPEWTCTRSGKGSLSCIRDVNPVDGDPASGPGAAAEPAAEPTSPQDQAAVSRASTSSPTS